MKLSATQKAIRPKAANVNIGPFTLHEIWDDGERIFKYQIRHGRTPQMRTRYKLHAEAVLIAWNALALGRGQN